MQHSPFNTNSPFQPPTGHISSRFESQSTIDEANTRKEQEWKAAYARLGQEPPKRDEEEVVHDGRTLAERIAINKEAKKEEWDQKMKLSNQYRGLDSEEMSFLAAKAREKQQEEQRKRTEEENEVREYREALAAKHTSGAAEAPPLISPPLAASVPASSTASAIRRIPPKPTKKDVKSLMKGVVVKKKPKAAPTSTPTAKGDAGGKPAAGGARLGEKRTGDAEDTGEDSKRTKVAAEGVDSS